MGRARPPGDTSESTMQPLYLPTDPPVVLAAGYGSDLVAFDASSSGSLVRWVYRVKLPDAANSERATEAFIADSRNAAPQAGWEIRSR